MRCSVEASTGLVCAGAAVSMATFRRGDRAAISGSKVYFEPMEALQAAGCNVIDDCGAPSQRTVPPLSCVHIAFPPVVINWCAKEFDPGPLTHRVRVVVGARTDDPNDMPTVCNVLSIAILCIAPSPLVRRDVQTHTRLGYFIEPAKG